MVPFIAELGSVLAMGVLPVAGAAAAAGSIVGSAGTAVGGLAGITVAVGGAAAALGVAASPIAIAAGTLIGGVALTDIAGSVKTIEKHIGQITHSIDRIAEDFRYLTDLVRQIESLVRGLPQAINAAIRDTIVDLQNADAATNVGLLMGLLATPSVRQTDRLSLENQAKLERYMEAIVTTVNRIEALHKEELNGIVACAGYRAAYAMGHLRLAKSDSQSVPAPDDDPFMKTSENHLERIRSFRSGLVAARQQCHDALPSRPGLFLVRQQKPIFEPIVLHASDGAEYAPSRNGELWSDQLTAEDARRLQTIASGHSGGLAFLLSDGSFGEYEFGAGPSPEFYICSPQLRGNGVELYRRHVRQRENLDEIISALRPDLFGQ